MSINKSRSKKLDAIINKLSVAQIQSAAREKGLAHAQVMKKLRERLRDK